MSGKVVMDESCFARLMAEIEYLRARSGQWKRRALAMAFPLSILVAACYAQFIVMVQVCKLAYETRAELAEYRRTALMATELGDSIMDALKAMDSDPTNGLVITPD